MALNISTNPNFTGRFTAADANYPYGSSKDESSPGANDGTPYIKQRADDLFGFMQALLSQGSVVPSGNADTALVSDYVDAIRNIINSEDADTLDGQEGTYYLARANHTGTQASSTITGNFPQSQITNLVTDLAAKVTQTTNLSSGSGLGAKGYFQFGNFLFNVGSVQTVEGVSPVAETFSLAFTSVINITLGPNDATNDTTPYVDEVTNSGFNLYQPAATGDAPLIHYCAIGWKS